VPFCKRALRALYALANSNRSAPYCDSSARKRTSEVIVFCTNEPTHLLSTAVRERCILRGVVLIGEGTLAITCVSRSLNAASRLYRVAASAHWVFGLESTRLVGAQWVWGRPMTCAGIRLISRCIG